MTENTYEYRSPSGRTAQLVLPYADAVVPSSLYVRAEVSCDNEEYTLVVPVTELLGLGAVVQDEFGVRWVRIEPSTYQEVWPWVNNGGEYVAWSEIGNPTVLSEGYTP